MRTTMALFAAIGLAGCNKDVDGDGFHSDEDCNDDDVLVNPNATEVCDGIDNNCDGSVDEGVATVFFLDEDNDSYGDSENTMTACELPAGYAELEGDCNDASADYYPGAPEADCTDPNDYNCDGSVGYADADDDGWAACEDCDDDDAERNPSAVEVCDEIDNDCNGVVDIDATETPTWYLDYDGDGFGDETVLVEQCEPPGRFVDNADDCDDSSAVALPGGAEVCDGYDNDCNGETDEGCGIDVAELSDAVLLGGSDQDYAGRHIAGVGDINNDGAVDVVVGADGVDFGAGNEGAAYVIFGPLSAGTDATLGDVAHVTIAGSTSDGTLGERSLGVGDVDGDSLADILVAAPTASDRATRSGTVHLVLGSTITGQSAGSTMSADSSDFQWHGNDAYDWVGEGLAALGDWDGDGYDDFAIGATGDESNGGGAGTIYVMLNSGAAPSGGSASVTEVASLTIAGNSGWYIGANIAGLGDMDGDGIVELGVGVIQAAENGALSGGAYLFGGAQSGAIGIDDADVQMYGRNTGDRAGAQIGPAGDVDGDGYTDVLVGVSRDDSGGADAGAVLLIHGRSDAAALDGSVLQDIADATVTGPGAAVGLGDSFVGNFDYDGDGNVDLLAGAPRDGLNQEGVGYLLLGPLSGTRSLATESYASFVGDAPNDALGSAVSVPGDLFGTGSPVVGLGSWQDDANGSDAGGVFFVTEAAL